MANTFTKIASVTVGSGGASSIDFTSIPSTYTDLCIKFSIRFDLPYDAANINIRFNSNASGYSTKRLKGTGSATQSDGSSGATSMVFNYGAGDTLTANTFGNGEIYIPNYAGSNNKSVSSDAVTENNATAAYVVLQTGLWSNTAAITSVSLLCDGNWKQYSTATLYGIKNS